MNFSIAIMAHHTRQNNLLAVHEVLVSQGVPSENITHIIDSNNQGIWATAMDAWWSHGHYTHHLVLQDDIIICKDFINIVNNIIQNLDNKENFGISFCDDIWEMRKAYQIGKRWLKTQKVRHAQALMLPVNWIEDWITWSEWNVRPEYYHDDGRLEMWLKHTKQFIYHSIPSLIQHEDAGSVFNQAQDKEKIRLPYTCWKYIEDDDKEDYDWSVTNKNTYSHNFTRNNVEQKFALGASIPLDFLERSTINSRIINRESIGITYEEVMLKARQERGLL